MGYNKQKLARSVFTVAQRYITINTTPAYTNYALSELALAAKQNCSELAVSCGKKIRVPPAVNTSNDNDFARGLHAIIDRLGQQEFAGTLRAELSADDQGVLRHLGVLQ